MRRIPYGSNISILQLVGKQRLFVFMSSVGIPHQVYGQYTMEMGRFPGVNTYDSRLGRVGDGYFTYLVSQILSPMAMDSTDDTLEARDVGGYDERVVATPTKRKAMPHIDYRSK